MTSSFEVFPKKWGIHLIPDRKIRLKDGDLELLEEMKEHFQDRHGEILMWAVEIEPAFPDSRHALDRLWQHGFVLKFAKQLHTIFGNPEYINWYIWSNENVGLQQGFNDGGIPRTAPHFMPE